MTAMQSQVKRNNRYRNKRSKQGWKWFSRICPPALAIELKKVCGDWKLNHPGTYRDESDFYKGDRDDNGTQQS